MFKSKSAFVSLLFFVALSLLASPAFATERADLVQSTPTNAKDRQLEGDEEDCHDDHRKGRKLEGDEEDCHEDHNHSSPAASLSTGNLSVAVAAAIAFSIF
ncbi:predicted protein [Chaetoceros tenuissimus]|uniref:Transmembrane protein n=1 Tax=Chaetoceros tenuissimus TaxID=426638 RepID=A0AAD3HAD5_9STRA|nr:predicted protein [Chaetoceros tenuissimus]